MSFRIKINLDEIPSGFKDLPHGRYLISLVKLRKFHAEKTNRPYFKWWWRIIEGKWELVGERFVSYTGIGTKESFPLMNKRLKSHLKALGLEYTPDFDIKELLYQRVTLDIDKTEDDFNPKIRMMPAEYYEYSKTWRPDGWLW